MQGFEKEDVSANRKEIKRINGIIPIILWNTLKNFEETYDFLQKI